MRASQKRVRYNLKVKQKAFNTFFKRTYEEDLNYLSNTKQIQSKKILNGLVACCCDKFFPPNN